MTQGKARKVDSDPEKVEPGPAKVVFRFAKVTLQALQSVSEATKV